MKILIRVFLTLMFWFGTSVSIASEFRNIEEVLIYEHGWDKDLIGPIGQSYTITLDASGNSVIELHPIISSTYNTSRQTPICSIFSKNRELKFSSDVFEGYSHDAANVAMRKYILQGEEAMSEADWLLSDKGNWFRYLDEGVASSSSFNSAEQLFQHTFEIENCETYNVTLSVGSQKITMPNLILTMPKYVLVSQGKESANLENDLSELYSMLEKAGAAIADGLLFATENNLLTYEKAAEVQSNLVSGNVTTDNLIFIGSICQAIDGEGCATLLIEGNAWPNGMNDYISQVKAIFDARNQQ